MQTAVKWLNEQLEGYGDPQMCEISWQELDELIQNALKIERFQIVRAVNRTNQSVVCTLSGIKYDAADGDEYYDKTFNQDI